MSVETDEMRAWFVDPDDFGVAALVAGTITVNCIFVEPYADEMEVEGTNPSMTCVENDLPSGTAHGTAVVILSRDFVICEMQPDGTGFTKIMLEERTN